MKEIPKTKGFLNYCKTKVPFNCCTKSQESTCFLTWWLNFPKKQRVCRTTAGKSKRHKWFSDLMIEVPRRQRVCLIDCRKTMEPQILELTAFSVHWSPKSWKLQHFQLWNLQTLPLWAFFRSRAIPPKWAEANQKTLFVTIVHTHDVYIYKCPQKTNKIGMNKQTTWTKW